MIMFLIALSAIFSYGIIWEQIPQALSAFVLGVSTTPWVVMFIIVVFLLIAGMFMDSTVLILLLTSILLPIAKEVGVDPVHFGIIMVMTLTIGLLTPPVGVVMYIVCSIFDCTIQEFLKDSLLFLLIMVFVVSLIIFFPDIALFVPNLIFGKG
jgi:tripartite ATP-independent transporter DctM subunit